MSIGHARRHRRHGNIVVVVALLMVLLLGVVAFAIDVGYISLAKEQLQRAADAAAHAAVMDVNHLDTARLQARRVMNLNPVAGQQLQLPDADILFGRRTYGLNLESGQTEYQYEWGSRPYNSVKVTARKTEASPNGALELFFARMLGIPQTDISAEAITAINPRDIVFVMDISGSMHHDNELWCIPLLNWVAPDLGDGTGAGTRVQEVMWEDFGLAAAGVPMDIVNNQTAQYTFDFADRTKNLEMEVPQLSGMTVSGSLSYYRSQVSGLTTSNTRIDAAGKIQIRPHFEDLRNLVKNYYIYTKWPTDWKASYATVNGKVDYIGAYDVIIDKYLPRVMTVVKPSVLTAANRDYYRTYWRGYVGYVRGFSSGDGDSSGIEGFYNPSTWYTEAAHKDLYRRPDGSQYPYSLQAEMDKLKNRVNYATYIQFMLDHANNRHAGRLDNGSDAPDAEQLYSPKQLTKFLEQGGAVEDVYRRWSETHEVYLPAREFPGSAVQEATLAAVKELRLGSEGLPEAARDNVAVISFSTGVYAITGTSTEPFLDVVADYDQLIGDVIAGGQSIDGSTNTQSGMRKAFEWLRDSSRAHTSKVVILFTDGVANLTSGALKSVNGYNSVYIDLDGDGVEDDRFFLSTSSSDPKNAALREVQDIWANNGVVHAITAGVGRDNDVTRRMALLTKGIWQDSGANFDEYAENLIRDFERLAHVRSITFGLER